MRRAVVVLPILLMAIGCDGDDEAASPITSGESQPPVTAAPTVGANDTDPETTVADTTSPPEATAAATAPPPSTTGTTTPGLTADEQAVVDAAVASWTAFNDVLLDPFDDARIEAAAQTRTGAALDRLAEVAAERRSERVRSVTNPDLPAGIVVFEDTLVFDGEDSATIDYCRLDSNVSVEIGGGIDGSDLVLDDTISAVWERDTFSRVDGSWLKESGVQLERFDGATECDRSA